MTNAVIVFHGNGTGWFSRFLKPGFRHCFAVVAEDGLWILFDPRRDRIDIRVLAAANTDIAQFYREQGYRVAEIDRPDACALANAPTRGWPRWPVPVMPATCVAAVKRVAGINAPLAQTPYGLWRVIG